MTAPLVVIDTSVLFSYALHPNRNYAIWESVLSGEIVALACDATLTELRDVACRHISFDAVDAFVHDFLKVARVVPNPSTLFVLRDDHDDSVFFNLAIENQAHYLISYDKAHVIAVRESGHPQHQEIGRLAPDLRVL